MQRFKIFARIYLILLGLATLNVAIQGLLDPQAIMDNVQVTLGNLTARSSVRALYGGVNLALALYWLYAAFKSQREGLRFALLYTGGFALGRLVGIALEGLPGAFATQWLVTESVFAVLAAVLLVRPGRRAVPATA